MAGGKEPAVWDNVREQGSRVGAVLPYITGAGGASAIALVWIGLFLSDKLHTDGEFRREAAALEQEKAAHGETRKALSEASARADVAVRASEMIADAFGAARVATGRGAPRAPRQS